jgi:hypothetical protein
MKNFEVIADNLSKAGFSWGCVSAIDSNRRTIWIVDAHHGDGKRFVVRADERLTAFVELAQRPRPCARSAKKTWKPFWRRSMEATPNAGDTPASTVRLNRVDTLIRNATVKS